MTKKSTKCENCGHDIEFEVKESKPQQVTFEMPSASTSNPAQTQVMQSPSLIPPAPPTPEPKKEEKKLSHEELSEMIPDGINAMACPGGDCGHMKLKNKNQTKKWKSCPNCEANTVPKGHEFCPYCTKNLDPDELESGVELEEEEEEDE